MRRIALKVLPPHVHTVCDDAHFVPARGVLDRRTMRWLPIIAAALCFVVYEPTSFAGPKCPKTAQKAKAKKAKHALSAKHVTRQHANAKAAPKTKTVAPAKAKPAPAPAKTAPAPVKTAPAPVKTAPAPSASAKPAPAPSASAKPAPAPSASAAPAKK
jgi:hypothetical protein